MPTRPRWKRILDSNWLWCILIALGGITSIYFIDRRDIENENSLREQIKFLNRVCEKTGTSYDRIGGAYVERTIFKCPDGQTHIR